MDRPLRDRFTVLIGAILIALGVLWMLELAIDIDVPWEYVLPATLVGTGVVLVFGRSDNGPGGGGTPSQFERDDAPRVP
jgi:hypothetical protein